MPKIMITQKINVIVLLLNSRQVFNVILFLLNLYLKIVYLFNNSIKIDAIFYAVFVALKNVF